MQDAQSPPRVSDPEAAARPTASVTLIAGAGDLPLEAAACVAAGRGAPIAHSTANESIAAIGFEGITDPRVASDVAWLQWVKLGQLGELRRALARVGARRLLLVGKIPRSLLESAAPAFSPDAEALRWLNAPPTSQR